MKTANACRTFRVLFSALIAFIIDPTAARANPTDAQSIPLPLSDIDENCKKAADPENLDFDQCLAREYEAKDWLEKNWVYAPDHAREKCIKASLGPLLYNAISRCLRDSNTLTWVAPVDTHDPLSKLDYNLTFENLCGCWKHEPSPGSSVTRCFKSGGRIEGGAFDDSDGWDWGASWRIGKGGEIAELRDDPDLATGRPVEINCRVGLSKDHRALVYTDCSVSEPHSASPPRPLGFRGKHVREKWGDEDCPMTPEKLARLKIPSPPINAERIPEYDIDGQCDKQSKGYRPQIGQCKSLEQHARAWLEENWQYTTLAARTMCLAKAREYSVQNYSQLPNCLSFLRSWNPPEDPRDPLHALNEQPEASDLCGCWSQVDQNGFEQTRCYYPTERVIVSQKGAFASQNFTNNNYCWSLKRQGRLVVDWHSNGPVPDPNARETCQIGLSSNKRTLVDIECGTGDKNRGYQGKWTRQDTPNIVCGD
jgi:hypothetical protein